MVPAAYQALAMPGRRRKATPRPKEALERVFVGEWIVALGFERKTIIEGAPVSESYLSQLINERRIKPGGTILRGIARTMGIPTDLLYELPPPRDVLTAAANLSPELLQRLRDRSPR